MSSPASTALRIIQLSDPHLFAQPGRRLLNVDTEASLQAVLAHIRAHETDIDVLLATGDLAQDGSPQAYQRFIALTQSVAPMLRVLPGNHDQGAALLAVFGDLAQAVTDLPGWRLVMLDSSIPGSDAGHLGDDQLALLQQAIATAQGRHVLVAVHHNPVAVGSAWLDTMLISNGAQLLDMLQVAPAVRGLVWGHVHQAFDQWVGRAAAGVNATDTPAGLRLLAVPSTCVQFKPLSQSFALDDAAPGYRRLVLHADGRIDTEIVRVTGLDLAPDTTSQGY